MRDPRVPNSLLPFGDRTPAGNAVGWLPRLRAGLADRNRRSRWCRHL